MARNHASLLLLALLGLAAIASAKVIHPDKMCDKKKGWQSFKVVDGIVEDEQANAVLEKAAGYVVADLAKKNIMNCPYGGKYALKDCMKSKIKKSVVKYGSYDQLFKLFFVCPDGQKWMQVRAISQVGRKGNMLKTEYTAKPIAA